MSGTTGSTGTGATGGAVSLFAPGGECCNCGIACSPCKLPTSGTLRAYQRTTKVDGTCTVCDDQPYLEDLSFNSGTPELISGAGAGYWWSAAFSWRQASCGTGFTYWTRFVLACVNGNLQCWALTYATQADAVAGTGANGSLQLAPFNANWSPTAQCAPFELRDTVHTTIYVGSPAQACTYLSNDVWIYIP